jgi:hypothetical protein
MANTADNLSETSVNHDDDDDDDDLDEDLEDLDMLDDDQEEEEKNNSGPVNNKIEMIESKTGLQTNQSV